jgi:hypothetical protein
VFNFREGGVRGDLHIIAILWGEIGKARKRMFLVSGFTDDVR